MTIALAAGACSVNGQHPAADRGTGQALRAYRATSDDGMVSSGSVEATRAGVAILERGGNAVDAAVATAFALGVSDPGGSGLGGATYMLIVPSDAPPVALDGSTPAPVASDPARLRELRDAEQHPGYASVSVPTTAATLEHALTRYGTMELAEVLEPAIGIAEQGFRLTANSIVWAQMYIREIRASDHFRFVILDDGEHLGEPGDRLCRPELRSTLERLARDGIDTFYRGQIAAEIVADMTANGGFLRDADLAAYRPRELQPLRSRYRDAEIITFPLPGGGAEVAAALNILAAFPSRDLATPTVERLHLLVEAARIAKADHLRHISSGASSASGAPGGYLTAHHARQRASLIEPGRAIPEEALAAEGPILDLGDNTTHLSVIDRDGTAVSMTQTLCRVYGSKVSTPGLGFPYNCCLESLDLDNADSPFSLRPRGVYPTGMAPTVLRHDRTVTALGSAGSNRITSVMIDVISNLVDRRLDLRNAIAAPRVLWDNDHDPPRVCLEVVRPISTADADRLQGFGFAHMFRLAHPTESFANVGYFGGVNAVSHDDASGLYVGVGDPRRSGWAAGPRAVAAAEPARD